VSSCYPVVKTLLHREISFEDLDEEAGIITRAWELSKRILIYCLYVNSIMNFSFVIAPGNCF
jgi:hypothetical protein